MKNIVLVITGPSGAGKTSISNLLKEQYNIPRVITHTTREPRQGEVNGVDYYFETPESFEKNHYIEKVMYSGFQYGSSYEGLEKGFKKSPILSVVLDTVGAQSYVKELGDQAVVIFVTVSDLQILRDRLLERGDTLSEITERTTSKDFIRDMSLPDDLNAIAHRIDNDDWEQTLVAVEQLISHIKNAHTT